MAAAHWRIRRAWAVESEMLQAGMANQSARLHITRAAALGGNENIDFDPSNIDDSGPKTVDIAPKTAEKRIPRRLLPPGPDITPPPPHSPKTEN
jgi:hypothetical protein